MTALDILFAIAIVYIGILVWNLVVPDKWRTHNRKF